MHANEMTFGIEIELTLPARSAIEVGAYHVGTQFAGLPTGWLAMRDGSISTTRGRIACEVVSPILRGAAGVAQVIEVVAKLNAMGAKVNESCGFHVHVGLPYESPKALDKLVQLVGHFEKAIYAATGTKRRERSSWCRALSQHGDKQNALNNAAAQRYHVLNLTNWARHTRPAVEFRAFAGTLNITKILGYVQMCVALVERASDTRIAAKFQPKASYPTTDRKGGAGQSALSRFFYQVGWTKGRVDRAFGIIEHAEAPSVKALKKELMRLAKQYDAEVA